MKVSFVCPTFNRHMYLPILIDQFKTISQRVSYETELIILDDTIDAYPFDEATNDVRVKYMHDTSHGQRMLWDKRNILNEMTTGDIIVCLDDDDISFADRVMMSIQALEKNERSLICGSSSIYMYDLLQSKFYLFRPKHSVRKIINSTFAYKRRMLKTCRYVRTKFNCYEEKTFTKDFAVPCVVLDPMHTVLCISHCMNTVDKRKFLVDSIKDPAVLSTLHVYQPSIQQFYDKNPMILWINMDTNHLRKKSMMSQLEGNGYHKRVSAVTEPSFRYNGTFVTKQEVACLESHIKALQECLTFTNYSWYVVCEDDIDFKKVSHFYERVYYYIRTAPKNWEILQLFVINHNLYKEKAFVTEDLLKWTKWTGCNYSTMIYIIKRSACQKVLSKIDQYMFKKRRCVADTFLYKNAITYTIKLPFFEEKIHEFKSDIHEEHVSMHEKYIDFLRKTLQTLNLKYPFFTI